MNRYLFPVTVSTKKRLDSEAHPLEPANLPDGTVNTPICVEEDILAPNLSDDVFPSDELPFALDEQEQDVQGFFPASDNGRRGAVHSSCGPVQVKSVSEFHDCPRP
jgi:hypothetical protein